MITFFYQFILFFVKIFLNLLNLKKITEIIKLKEENQIFKKKELAKVFFYTHKITVESDECICFFIAKIFFFRWKKKKYLI